MGQLDHVSVADLRGIVEMCEGWTIFSSEDEAFAPLPRPFVEKLSVKYKSSKTDPKGVIYGPDGQVKKEVFGIHDLSLLYAIARELGVNRDIRLTGRGFLARMLKERILKRLEEIENAEKLSGEIQP